LELSRFSELESVPEKALERIQREKSLSAKTLARNFNDGADFWILRLDGRIAGYLFSLWRSPAILREFPYLDVGEDGMIIFGTEVFRAVRGKGIASASTELIVDELAHEGARRAFRCCAKENVSSARAISKTRFQLVGEASAIRLLGHPWVIRSQLYDE
jgi:RimJ/RimL family protein N-acetyltransferase